MYRDTTISSNTAINTIAQELDRSIAAFDLYKASEYVMTEFIGPLLVVAVVLNTKANTEVKMVAGNKIVGSLGNGPVDYTLIYKELNICVVEDSSKYCTIGC